MPTVPTPSFFRELYELYRLIYFVYLAGDELRMTDRDHPLLHYLSDLDASPIGREFLREFADYIGDDPPQSIIKLALSRYHTALIQASQE